MIKPRKPLILEILQDNIGRYAGILILVYVTVGLVSCQVGGPEIQTLAVQLELTAASAEQSVTAGTPPPTHEGDTEIMNGWQRLDTTGGGAQTGIATHPTDPDIVYLSSDNGGLFKTDSGGDRWFSVSSNLGAYRLASVVLDPLNPEVIYVTASTAYGSVTMGGDTGEIYRSIDGGLSWTFLSAAMGFQNSLPNQAAIVIPYDPAHPGRFDQDQDGLSDVIVVGAWTGPADPPVGGVWRSEDEGQTFAHLGLKDRNVTALRAFAGDSNILFLTTHGGEVYQSEDLGTHWRSIAAELPLAHLADLAAHPTDAGTLYVTCRWCTAGDPPVWRTTDGGQNWHPVSRGLHSAQGSGFPKLLIDRFDPDTLYVTTYGAKAGKGGVYRSVDEGQSWHLMRARLVLPDGRPHFWYQFEGKFAIAQAIDGRLYAGNEGAWRYPDGDPADGVEEWEPIPIGVGNIHVNTVRVDPLDAAVLYQGISDFGPYKSVDRGASFHRILGNGWPVTVDNFVWNGPYYSSYRECWLSCSAICRKGGRIGSGGTTAFAISRQDSQVIYSAFGSGSGQSKHGGVNKSTDGGRTWQPVGFQLQGGFDLNPETCVPYGFQHLAIDPTDDKIVFAAMEIPPTKQSKLFKTIDGGTTWSKVFTGTGYIRGLAISPVNPNRVVFTTLSHVYISEHGGRAGSWQGITPPEATSLRVVSLSPHNERVYVVGTNDLGIYYTTDGGINWSNHRLDGFFEQKESQTHDPYLGTGNDGIDVTVIKTQPPDSDPSLDASIATAINPNARVLRNISAIVFDPIAGDTFYVGGTQYTRASFGVAKITDAGQKWERLPLEGLSHRNTFDLAIDARGEYLYAGTFDGTYRLKLR
jgi:photosystem II stability/assembly factor-like uncharacterized protein